MSSNSRTSEKKVALPASDHPLDDRPTIIDTIVFVDPAEETSVQKNQTDPSDEPTDPNLNTSSLRENPTPSIPAPQFQLPSNMPEMGALDSLMGDPDVTEIMVNDVRNVMIEKGGKLTFSGLTYQSLGELNRLVRNICDIVGKNVGPDLPYLDSMLPDGSRINIVVPPLTTCGPCITIRKFPRKRMSIHDLISAKMLDQRIAYFLNACVTGRLNILISGGTDSGKSTLLRALAGLIPRSERIITIEDTPELALAHPNSVQLQTKPATPSSPAVSATELVSNALRMRPDRIIIGECRRSEAFDMLQAMNTGHSGSMTTIHSNSARDSLSRLETLCMTSGLNLPLAAIRKQIVSALDLIIHVKRLKNGRRQVSTVTEVTGIEGETITLQEIFLSDSHAFSSSGFVPTFVDQLREQGIELANHFFE